MNLTHLIVGSCRQPISQMGRNDAGRPSVYNIGPCCESGRSVILDRYRTSRCLSNRSNINLCEHKILVQLEGNANRTCRIWPKSILKFSLSNLRVSRLSREVSPYTYPTEIIQ